MPLKVNPLNKWPASNTWGVITVATRIAVKKLKQRIAMAKEAFNRKISIFCGPLEKELRKRLPVLKCFVWSVVLYGAETWTLRRDEQKQLEAFEMCV